MDFMNRGFRNGQPGAQNVGQTTSSSPAPSSPGGKTRAKSIKPGNLGTMGKLAFFGLIVLLVVLAFVSIFTFKGGEARLVDDSKYQAVFLNGGQVYFGKINSLNNKFMQVNNVYYLRVNQQVQPDANAQTDANDISLVKLGCELHGPQDQMVINRDQIIFWENLKDDGQVAEAIAQYKEQFPNGQNCDEQASSTPTPTNGGSSATQPAGENNNTSDTPTVTPPAANPRDN